MKNTGCIGCHQLGQESTRTIPAGARHVRVVGAEAWRRRVQSGQAGQQMLGQLTSLGDAGVRQLTATGPIASPRASCRSPSRRGPQGVERNIVVTLRDWMNEKQYLHDLIASDRRNPDGQRLRAARTARPSTAPTRCRSSIR